ncbi:hypothetical protein OAU50_06920 [Planctomycetota bacterium]|nr:hypothetical protein [Planctomycetota bacterium]
MQRTTTELILSMPSAILRRELTIIIDGWKSDSSTVADLAIRLEDWSGKNATSSALTVQQFIRNFVKDVIDKIGGMTVNERLYWFCLFDEWEYMNGAEEERIRKKLIAPG